MSPFEDTIIDHLNIGVSDAEISRAFYAQALAPLGLKPHWAGQAAALGAPEGARALTERLGREALALLSGKA